MRSNLFLSETSISDPEQALIQLKKGITYNLENRLADAISTLLPVYQYYAQRSNDECSHYAKTAYFLGCSYVDLNAHTKALPYLRSAAQTYIEIYERSLSQDFSITQYYLLNAHHDLAQCLITLGKIDEASNSLTTIETYISMFKLPPNPDTNLKSLITNLYLMLINYGSPSIHEKINYSRKALALNPSPELNILFGTLMMESSDYLSAASHLARVIAQTTWNTHNQDKRANALYHLGKCNLGLRRPDQAICFLKKASSLYETQNDTQTKMACILGLALCYSKTSQFTESEDCFNQVLTYLKSIKSKRSLNIVHKIILDWCANSNFPYEFQLDKPHAQLFLNLVNSIEEELHPSLTFG